VQSSSESVTTNKPTPSYFTGRMPFLSPKQVCDKALKWKISHPMDLLTQHSPGVFQLCLWPLIAPGYYLGEVCHASSAFWCQYPNNKISSRSHIPKTGSAKKWCTTSRLTFAFAFAGLCSPPLSSITQAQTFSQASASVFHITPSLNVHILTLTISIKEVMFSSRSVYLIICVIAGLPS